MSQWETRFEDNAVWVRTAELGQILNDLPAADGSDEMLYINRIRQLHGLILEHRENGNKDVYSPRMFSTLDSVLVNQVNNYVNSFKDSPDSHQDHLRMAAVDGVDAALDAIAQWPAIPATGLARAAGKAFKEHEKVAVEALDETNRLYQELSVAFSTLKTDAATLRDQFDSVIAQFTSSLEERESEYTNAISIVEQSGADAYDKAIRRDLQARAAALDKILQDAKTELAEVETSAKQASEWEESSKSSANWLSEQAVATDFGRQARRKSAAGWLYDILGVAAGGVPLVLVLIHFLNDTTPGGSAVSTTIARASVTVAALVVAGYLFSRGSTNHRQARNRKSAYIWLRTLEAFISKLSADDAAEIRRGMAENIYLNGKLSDEEPDKKQTLLSSFMSRTSSDKPDEAENDK